MRNFIISLSVMALVGCGSEDKATPAEPTFADGASLALIGDTSGTYKTQAVLASADFKDCSFTVNTSDLNNLESIDGHAFKRVSVVGNPCDYYMSIEGLLTRTVKVCAGHAEVTITCHAQ